MFLAPTPTTDALTDLPELTLSLIFEAFTNFWVAIAVTKFYGGIPIAGYVVDSSRDRRFLEDTHPSLHTVFCTQPIPTRTKRIEHLKKKDKVTHLVFQPISSQPMSLVTE
ncbi:hypothetical protein ACQ4M3_29175 [Leptolyngbya sp. AN03gr2]|uniref:hypothetical protein n=1 Tax=unclassified Leptolyngbya TaxID=2650499 RepID=UPI003D31F563